MADSEEWNPSSSPSWGDNHAWVVRNAWLALGISWLYSQTISTESSQADMQCRGILTLSDSRISRLCLGRRDLDSLGIFWITDTGAGASIAVGAWAIAWAVGWVGCDIGWFVATGFGFGFGLWLGLRLGFADVVFLWWFVVVVV
jgi:hypothetical protein